MTSIRAAFYGHFKISRRSRNIKILWVENIRYERVRKIHLGDFLGRKNFDIECSWLKSMCGLKRCNVTFSGQLWSTVHNAREKKTANKGRYIFKITPRKFKRQITEHVIQWSGCSRVNTWRFPGHSAAQKNCKTEKHTHSLELRRFLLLRLRLRLLLCTDHPLDTLDWQVHLLLGVIVIKLTQVGYKWSGTDKGNSDQLGVSAVLLGQDKSILYQNQGVGIVQHFSTS